MNDEPTPREKMAQRYARHTLALMLGQGYAHPLTVAGPDGREPAPPELVARRYPDNAAAALIELVRRSASDWEHANDSTQHESARGIYEQQHLDHARAAEIVAEWFGCRLDWPGLYPTIHDAHGRTHHPDTDTLSTYARPLRDSIAAPHA